MEPQGPAASRGEYGNDRQAELVSFAHREGPLPERISTTPVEELKGSPAGVPISRSEPPGTAEGTSGYATKYGVIRNPEAEKVARVAQQKEFMATGRALREELKAVGDAYRAREDTVGKILQAREATVGDAYRTREDAIGKVLQAREATAGEILQTRADAASEILPTRKDGIEAAQ